MLSCEEVAKLVSQSMDTKLPFRQRVAMRFHIARCRCCPHLRDQLVFLHEALKEYVNRERSGKLRVSESLSSDAKARIQQAILNRKA